MKKIISTLFSLVFSIVLFAQQAPPQGINYQAMVYVPYGNQQVGVNSAGQIPANTKEVVVKFTLEEGNNGPVVYEETHIDTTDQYGLLNTVIGTGTPTSNSPGLFNLIDWSLGDPYLRVSITLTQYNSTVSSYQKLWSVPYALYAGHANTADFATNSAHADSSDYAEMAGNGITGVTDNGDGTLTFNYLDGSSYTTVVLNGLIGVPGLQGPSGQNGQSAYEIWQAQGNMGTQQDFLNSLQGATGAQGPIGLTGPQGVTGPAGPQGTPGSQNAWSLTGNAGTNPTTNFIGTTDTQDWVIKTNNSERIRIKSDGNVGIGTNNPISQLQIVGTLTSQTTSTNNITRAINDNNSLQRYTERLNILGSSTQLDLDPFSSDATGNLTYRYFRHSNTTGSKAIQFLRGNGTTQGSAQIGVDGATSYFQLQGGNFGIGIPNPTGKFHVNNDVSGSDSSFVVTSDGKIGIGTSSPTDKVVVQNGGVRINGQFGIGFNDDPYSNNNVTGLEGAKIYWEEGTINTSLPQSDYLVIEKKDGNSAFPDGGIAFANRGNTGLRTLAMVVTGQGNIGVGTISPDQLLSVNGNASKAGGGSWATFSDRRVKHNIKPFNDGLDVLMRLNPVTFKYNEKSGYSDLNKTFVGFIAQDVEQVAPYMVNIFDDSKGVSGLSDKRQFDESALNKILVNAVQEQQAQIDQLKKELEEMKSELMELKKN
jgi:hypothetical protein